MELLQDTKRLVVADTQGFGAVGFERWQKSPAWRLLHVVRIIFSTTYLSRLLNL